MVDIAIFGVSQRCGSTLMQRIFNLDRDTLVWGENGRMIDGYREVYQRTKKFSMAGAKERAQYFESNRDSSIFIANMSPDWPSMSENQLDCYRDCLTNIYNKEKYGVKRIGFKEVLHPIASVKFLKLLFPEIKIVTIARNPVDSWKSVHHWKKDWNKDGAAAQAWVKEWYSNLEHYLNNQDILDFFWFEDIVYERKGIDKLAALAQITEKEVIDLIDAGRVGGTAEKVKKDVASIDIEIINKYIQSQPASPVKEVIETFLEAV